MLPLRLEIRNFLAYRQPDPVNFEGMHLACLTGPNGAGKSTLLDAITWVLWGQARTRSDDDLIYQGQTDMLVQLDFLQHETRYRVVRKRQKGKNARTGRSALELYVWDEALNQFETITAPSIADTQKKIIGLLRMDYDIFVNSAFLQQGRADAFTIKTPSRRKEILGEILGLDQWKDYEERAKAVLHEIDHELGVIAYRLERSSSWKPTSRPCSAICWRLRQRWMTRPSCARKPRCGTTRSPGRTTRCPPPRTG